VEFVWKKNQKESVSQIYPVKRTFEGYYKNGVYEGKELTIIWKKMGTFNAQIKSVIR